MLYLAAETEPHEGKRKQESLWPIFKIHHQKSRYIYDLYYRRKAISRGKSIVLIIYENHATLTKTCSIPNNVQICRAVRVLPQREYRRQEPHSQMEKSGVREPVLPEVYSNEGHELRNQLHLQGAKGETRGGSDSGVYPLRLPWLFWLSVF